MQLCQCCCRAVTAPESFCRPWAKSRVRRCRQRSRETTGNSWRFMTKCYPMLNFWAAAVKMNDSGLWMQHGLAKYSFLFWWLSNLQHFTEGEWLAFQLRDDFVPCFEASPLSNSNLPPASAQVAQAMLAQGGRVNVEVGCLVMDLWAIYLRYL